MPPQNQPGQGVVNEVVLSALFALRLFLDDTVVDFEIETNKNLNQKKKSDDNNFKFDDIIITIFRKEPLSTLHFAIQAKHADDDENKSIQPQNFVCGRESQNEQKGKYVLSMYCKSSFCDLVIDCDQAGCQDGDGCKKIHCERGDRCKLPHRKIIEISRVPNEFLYILYTNKPFYDQNVSHVKEFTMTKIDDCKGKDFFLTSSHSRKSEIYKFAINNDTKETESVKRDDYDMFFQNFSLYVGQNNAKEVEAEIRQIFEKEFHSSSCVDTFITFFRHCHDDIYLDRKVDKEIVRIQLIDMLLPQAKLAFTDDLRLFETASKKLEITLVEDDFSKVDSYCTDDWSKKASLPDEQLLLEGKKKKLIPRSCTAFDLNSKIKVLLYCDKYPIITNYDNFDKFRDLYFDKELRFVIFGSADHTTFSRNTVFQYLEDIYEKDSTLADEIFDKLNFSLRENLVVRIGNVTNETNRLYQYISSSNILEILKQKYSIEDTPIRQKQIYLSRRIIHSDCAVPDSQLIGSFATSRNFLLCGKPGSGKTELVKFLSKNCTSDYYTVYVNFKQHSSVNMNSFLNINSGNIHTLQTQLKLLYKEKKKILFFFDALDEAFNKTSAIECLKGLQERNFHFWVASRDSLRGELQRKLNIDVVEIEELDEDGQKTYVKEKMKSNYDISFINDTIEKIKKIRASRAENCNLVSLPLNLNMLIKIFNNNQYLGDSFEVNDMYHSFIDGNFSHYLKKNQVAIPEFPILTFLKYYFWEQYENAAIENCFDPSVKMHRSRDSYYRKFLEFIENHKEDPLGIICLRDDGGLEFLHRSYAEFFVALWISKNFELVNSDILKNVIIHEQHQNIRHFLDLELAQGNPLFLAVLRKDLKRVRQNVDKVRTLDKAGRNILHLICSQNENELLLAEVLKNIPEPTKMNVKDGLFNLTPLEYCQHFQLPNLANILRKYSFTLSEKMMYEILDYAISGNHRAIIEEMIKDCDPLVSDYLFKKQDVLFNPVKRKHLGVVSCLQLRVNLETEDSSRKTVLYHAIDHGFVSIVASLIAGGAETLTFSTNFTPLQLSASRGHQKICSFLVRTCGLDVNAKGNGFSALHIAILHHQTELAKFLVNKLGADRNSICQSGVNFRDNDVVAKEILGPLWPDVRSYEERSVLDLAIDCGHITIVEFLFEIGAMRWKFQNFEPNECLNIARSCDFGESDG